MGEHCCYDDEHPCADVHPMQDKIAALEAENRELRARDNGRSRFMWYRHWCPTQGLLVDGCKHDCSVCNARSGGPK